MDGEHALGRPPRRAEPRAARGASWAFCGLILAGCASGPPDVPASAAYAGHAQCKIMYDQAMVVAHGYSSGQAAKQLYWDCIKAR